MFLSTWGSYILPLVLFITTTSLWLPSVVEGHGRLIEPPSRASAWRYGFKTPPNYNDHELYCGGYNRQHQKNHGNCGICGDPWDLPAPRPHEFGGIYGQGIIVRKYNPSSVIIVRVELTANHFGYFQFKLCQNFKNTTQQCLDRHVLKLASTYSTRFNGKLVQDDPQGYKFYPRDGNKIYEMRYKLPDFSCAHCLLQWTYTAGNNWGNCPNGTGAVGCGPQETFRACADIAIGKGHITDISSSSEENIDIFTTKNSNEIDEYYRYDGIKTLIVAGASLFAVILLIAILYTYYYQLGKRIKGWLKFDNTNKSKIEEHNKTVQGIVIPPPPKGPAPVPPPRVRKHSNSMMEIPDVQYKTYNNKPMTKIYNNNVNLMRNESLA